MFKKAEEKQILSWIQKDDIASLGAYLVSGNVHGKPGLPTAELTRLEKILSKNLDPSDLYQLGKKLLKRPEYAARSLGVGFISNGENFSEIEKLVLKAAEDEEWMVREVAAGVMGSLLHKDFTHFSKVFQKWVEVGSVNAKRAVALAVKYDSRHKDPKRWKAYLKLIEPLLSEEAEYIQKNLGPFAIGDGLLSRFPEETLEASKKWATSKNEHVRWNVAMIFTAATARKFRKEGSHILKSLAEDKDKRVQVAVKKALKNIGNLT